jgi:hypothetical protein
MPIRREAPVAKECIDDSPTKSITYVLTAVGEDKQPESRRLSVEVVSDKPPLKHARIIDFDASETRIRAGASVRLCYSIADAEQAFLGPPRRDVSNGKNCIDDSPRKSIRYVLTAVGEDRQPETRAINVEVAERENTPSVRITRLEIKRSALHGFQVCYAVENAVSANIDPQFGTVKLPGDCKTFRSTRPITFTLSARDANGGSDRRSVDYQPPEEPKPMPIHILKFWTTTPSIAIGAQARICHSIVGEGRAQISPLIGAVNPSLRDCNTVALRESTTFTLTVTGAEGQRESKTVTVNVQPNVIR